MADALGATHTLESPADGRDRSADRRRRAAHLGMWIFLAGEILLFSALFGLYAGSRWRWPEAFAAAAGDTVLWMGTTGTVALLTASWLVATSLESVREGRGRAAAKRTTGAAMLGCGFLGLKLWEYGRHLSEGLVPGGAVVGGTPLAEGEQAFWSLYYLMTGVHALHVLGGIAVLAWLTTRIERGAFNAGSDIPVELGGMYWHLVDVVWLFLWPFFYLMRS